MKGIEEDINHVEETIARKNNTTHCFNVKWENFTDTLNPCT